MSQIVAQGLDCSWTLPPVTVLTASAELQNDNQLPGRGQSPNVVCCGCIGCNGSQDSSSALPCLLPPPQHYTDERWAPGLGQRSPPFSAPDYMQAVQDMAVHQIDAVLTNSFAHPAEVAANEAWLENAMRELTGPIPDL